jgi:hypothetical protein
MKDDKLEIYTIYENTFDFPNEFVIKKWLIDGKRPYQELNYLFNNKDLEKCREEMHKKGLFNLGRGIDDDPVIVESWI